MGLGHRIVTVLELGFRLARITLKVHMTVQGHAQPNGYQRMTKHFGCGEEDVSSIVQLLGRGLRLVWRNGVVDASTRIRQKLKPKSQTCCEASHAASLSFSPRSALGQRLPPPLCAHLLSGSPKAARMRRPFTSSTTRVDTKIRSSKWRVGTLIPCLPTCRRSGSLTRVFSMHVF